MGFWSKLRSAFASREDKINSCARVIVAACAEEVPDSEAVAMLSAVSSKSSLAPLATMMLTLEPPQTDKQRKDIYIVSLTEQILLLFKEDTRDVGGSIGNEEGRQMRRMEQQRLDIDWSGIDQKQLRIALDLSYGIKLHWHLTSSPWWRFCRRHFDLELSARSEAEWEAGFAALRSRVGVRNRLPLFHS